MIAISSTDKKGTDILAVAQALQVYMASLISGEMSQFNRQAGGPISPYSTAITSTAVNAVKTTPCLFYGLFVSSSGGGTGTVSIWDGTTAQTTWLSAVAISSAGSFIPAAAPGIGVLFQNGLSVQQSSGAVIYPIVVASST